MALEYKLSYTAEEIDEKLGLVGQNVENIEDINEEIENINASLEGKADKDHTHDYAEIDHTHNYAEVDHTHDNYAEVGHTHDNYAEVNHVHDYAEINHEHDNYANINHEHDYAETDHNHDDKYDELGASNVALGEAKNYTDNAVKAVKDDLLNGAGSAYDTLKELGDLIDDNQDAIEALELVATSKADVDHTHPGLEVVSETEPSDQVVGAYWVKEY